MTFDPLSTINSLSSNQLSGEIEILITLTLLSFIPFFLIATTTFTRNIIVLSFLRSALGLQQSPPNIVIISLALFITLFTMQPVLTESYKSGVEPYLEKNTKFDSAVESAWKPLKNFLITQTNEADLGLIYKISNKSPPISAVEIEPTILIPAFMLSELKLAFKIGFVIFLPFLLLDFVVAAILMSLGMIMVPPVTISLPLKIMLFVVIDGWALIFQTLLKSAI